MPLARNESLRHRPTTLNYAVAAVDTTVITAQTHSLRIALTLTQLIAILHFASSSGSVVFHDTT